MKNYNYTVDWFGGGEDLKQIIKFDNQSELHILEIGSFEGRSTIWFLENLLKNSKSTITCVDPWTSYSQNSDSFNSYDTENTEWNFKTHKNTFLYNIAESGCESQVIVKDGFSHKILPELILQNKKYDIIYIDGNHTSPFVLTDAVFSWYLLNNNGFMIFDDYLWGHGSIDTLLTPKLAIDSFINIYDSHFVVVWDEYKKAIQKIK
jgi:predicted O-methyltransferase YrrM